MAEASHGISRGLSLSLFSLYEKQELADRAVTEKETTARAQKYWLGTRPRLLFKLPPPSLSKRS